MLSVTTVEPRPGQRILKMLQRGREVVQPELGAAHHKHVLLWPTSIELLQFLLNTLSTTPQHYRRRRPKFIFRKSSDGDRAGRKGAVLLTLFRDEAFTSLCNTMAGCVTSEVSCVPKYHDLYLSEVFFIFNTWLNSWQIDTYLSMQQQSLYAAHKQAALAFSLTLIKMYIHWNSFNLEQILPHTVWGGNKRGNYWETDTVSFPLSLVIN